MQKHIDVQQAIRRMRLGFMLVGLLLVVVWGLVCYAWYRLQHDDVVHGLNVEISHHLEASESHVVNDLSQITALLRALSESHLIRSLLAGGQDKDAYQDLHAVLSSIATHIVEFRLLDGSGMERVRLTGSGVAHQVPSGSLVSRASSRYFQAARSLPVGHVFLSPVSVASRMPGDNPFPMPMLRVAMPVAAYPDVAGVGRGTVSGVMVLVVSGRMLYWHHNKSPLPDHGSLRLIEDGYVYRLHGDGVDVSRPGEFQGSDRVLLQEKKFRPAAWLPLGESQLHMVWRFSESLPAEWLAAQLRGKEVEAWVLGSVGSIWMGLLLGGMVKSRRKSLVADAERQRLLVEVKGLSQRLMEVHEEELRSLAGVLHNDVGQTLAAVQMRISSLALDCEGEGCAAAGRVREEEAYVGKVMETLRGQLRLLRPPQLDAFGLRGALLALLEDIKRQQGIDVEADIDETVDGLDDLLRLGIYRLVQEVLANTLRHASASRVRLRLGLLNGWVDGLIEDDGCGFDVTQESAGYGLVGMRERVELLGGKMQMDSMPGSGTRLHLSLPAGSGARGQ